jgi:hypothetical protein
MCSLCETATEGRSYCPKCFDLLFFRGALQSTQATFNLPRIAMVLAVVSWLTGGACGLAVIFGILSIVTAAAGLRRIARQPDLPGRRICIASIVAASLSTTVWCAYYVWLIVGIGGR